MLLLALSLALAPPAAVTSRAVTVPGELVDVLDHPGAPLLSVTHRGARKLFSLPGGRPIAVPEDAVFVDVCAGRVVFATPAGVRRDDGELLLAGDALFRVADPARLFRTSLCDAGGAPWLPTPDGLLTSTGLLSLPRAPRAYSGEAGGLRGRPFGAALSLYAPHALEADLDGDGDLDLVLAYGRAAAAFRRGGRGLEPRAHPIPLPRAGGDLRFHLADLDGDDRAELVVTALKGLVPERTRAWRVSRLLDEPVTAPLWDRPGFTAPLHAGDELLVFHVDTSVVAMGAVLVTGQLPLRIERWSPRGFQRLIDLEIGASVTAGITGALPVLADLDDDGDLDLVATGPAEARLYTREGDAFTRPRAFPVDEVRATHAAGGAVLILGAPARGKTRVVSVQLGDR